MSFPRRPDTITKHKIINMRFLFFLPTFFLFHCLQANGQDYLKLANDCFEKGDYECAKRNYTFFQTLDGSDLSVLIQKADDCYKASIIADAFYTEKDYEKALDRYKIVLEKNPKDLHAKKLVDSCIVKLNPPTIDKTDSQPKPVSSKFANFTEITNNLNIEMVAVQGGTFTMGCTPEQGDECNKDERPAHQVTVSDYYIGKYEVTQAQWQAVMRKNRSKHKGYNLPVEHVTWEEVQAFIRKLNTLTGKKYRLLTEAEWEFAARGGNKSRQYKYSGSNIIDSVAWYNKNSRKSQVVGTKAPNELGIYDMSGNVWEWCSDRYGGYNSHEQTNPTGTSSLLVGCVLRGGSRYNYAQLARVSLRNKGAPNTRGRRQPIGFRLACSSNE